MKVVAISGQKGGGGRTTVALNLAYELSHQGLRVLLIDGDTTGGIGLSIAPSLTNCPGLVRFVLDDLDWRKCAVETTTEGLKIVPRGPLRPEERALFVSGLERGRLGALLEASADSHDITLIDTAAGGAPATLAALRVADYSLGIVPADPLGLRGVADYLRVLGWLRREGACVRLMGLVPTMVDLREATSSTAIRALWGEFPDGSVFDTFLPRDPAFLVASEAGVPLGLLSRRPKLAASAVEQLAHEFRRRLRQLGEEPADDAPRPLLG